MSNQAKNSQAMLKYEAKEADAIIKTYPSVNGDAQFFIAKVGDTWKLTGVARGVLIRLQPRLTASEAFDKFKELADIQI